MLKPLSQERRLVVPASVARQTLEARARLGAKLVPDLRSPHVRVQRVTQAQLDPLSRGERSDRGPKAKTGLLCRGYRIDREEFEATALALRTGAVLVVDDRAGIQCAKRLGVPFLTTRDVLAQAEASGIIRSAAACLRKIEATGYFPTKRVPNPLPASALLPPRAARRANGYGAVVAEGLLGGATYGLSTEAFRHAYRALGGKPAKWENPRRRNSDEELRALERAAQFGDPGALQRLDALKARSGIPTDELDEKIVLFATMGFKPSYEDLGTATRFVYAHRATAITPARWEAAKARLIAKRILNKAGAVTPAGRAGSGHRPGERELDQIGRSFGVDSMRSEFFKGDAKKLFDAHYQGRKPNPATLADSAESWAARRGMRLPARGTAAWSGMFAAWQRGGMKENPLTGVEAHGVLMHGLQNMRDASNTTSPTRAAYRAGKAKARGGVVYQHGPTAFRAAGEELAERASALARAAGRVRGDGVGSGSRANWIGNPRRQRIVNIIFPTPYLYRQFRQTAMGSPSKAMGEPRAEGGWILPPGSMERFNDLLSACEGRTEPWRSEWDKKANGPREIRPSFGSRGRRLPLSRKPEVFEALRVDWRGKRLGVVHADTPQRAMGLADDQDKWAKEKAHTITVRGEWTSDGTHWGVGRGRMVALKEKVRWHRENNPGAFIFAIGNKPKARQNGVVSRIKRFLGGAPRPRSNHVGMELRLPAKRVKATLSVQQAMKVPGMEQAIKRYRQFHGCDPTNVIVYDDGRPGDDAGFIIGRSPEITYTDVPVESNKGPGGGNDGVLWVHKTSKQTPTYLAHLVNSKNTVLIGDMAHDGVRDWLTERNER